MVWRAGMTLHYYGKNFNQKASFIRDLVAVLDCWWSGHDRLCSPERQFKEEVSLTEQTVLLLSTQSARSCVKGFSYIILLNPYRIFCLFYKSGNWGQTGPVTGLTYKASEGENRDWTWVRWAAWWVHLTWKKQTLIILTGRLPATGNMVLRVKVSWGRGSILFIVLPPLPKNIQKACNNCLMTEDEVKRPAWLCDLERTSYLH